MGDPSLNRELLLTCPYCSAALRLGDRSFVGKRAGCPQCGDAIHLAVDGEHGVRGAIPAEPATGPLLHGALEVARPRPSVDVRKRAAPERQVPAPATATSTGVRDPVAVAFAALENASVDVVPASPLILPDEFESEPLHASPESPPPHAAAVVAGSSPRVPASIAATVSAALPSETLFDRLMSPVALAAMLGTVFLGAFAFLAYRSWPGDADAARPIAAAIPSKPRGRDEGAAPGINLPEVRGDSARDPLNVEAPRIDADGRNTVDPPDARPTPESLPESPPDRPRQPPVGRPEPDPAVAEVPAAPSAHPDAPAAVAPAPAVPVRDPIDVAARLKAPILKFDQPRAVPVRDLLLLVEDMTGVPVTYDRKALGALAEGLDRPTTLRLQRTTVEGILDAVAGKAGLSWSIDGESIRLHAN